VSPSQSLPPSNRTDSNHKRVERKDVLLITTLTQVHWVFREDDGTKLAGSANRSCPDSARPPATLCTMPRGFRSMRQVCIGGIGQSKPPPQCAYVLTGGARAEGVPERVGRRGRQRAFGRGSTTGQRRWWTLACVTCHDIPQAPERRLNLRARIKPRVVTRERMNLHPRTHTTSCSIATGTSGGGN
jgi:hypothetical protein